MIAVGRTLKPWIIILVLFGSTYATQVQYDRLRIDHLRHDLSVPVNEVIEPTVPGDTTLRNASFGFNTMWADVLWLQVIQYYGGGDPYGNYRQLPRLIQAINILDPKFTYPYSFAGLVLPNEGFSDQALAILQNGEKALPDSWEIPYDEGTIDFINKKDAKAAALNFERASQKPDAPPLTAFLSAVQYDKINDRASAKAIFQSLATLSNNDYFKNRALAYVAHYQLLDDLESTIKAFHDREGRYPTTLQELVTRHYVQSIPDDPLQRAITYNAGDGTVDASLQKESAHNSTN